MMTRFLASGLVASMLMVGLQTWRLDRERLDHAITKQEHVTLVIASETAAREAEKAARLEEQRRVEALQGIIHETESKLARARTDAAAARDAGIRLRQRINEITATCRGGGTDNPDSTSGSEATNPTGDLLANVQQRLDEASDDLARFADASHIAGLACEQGWDALSR